MRQKGRVLGVFAHPDDETYGPGATLARLAAEGSEVRLVTMTRGESASMGDSRLFSPELLAEIRGRELDCACRALGIAHNEQLTFPDGGLSGVAEDELAAPILKALEEFRPHLVITFHPEGISGHEDHRAVSRIVAGTLGSSPLESRDPSRAPAGPRGTGHRGHPVAGSPGRSGAGSGGVGGAGPSGRTQPPRPRLAYYAVPRSVAAIIKWRRLYAVPDEAVTHAVATGEYIEAKARAAECHKTQRYLFEKLSASPGGIERVWKTECFILDGDKSVGAPHARLPVTL